MRIAIDPGKTGAIAVMDWDKRVWVESMPATPRDTYDRLSELSTLARHAEASVCAHIEQVGLYFPGKNPQDDQKRMGALLKLRQHLGELHGFMYALRIPFRDVMPRSWMKRVVTKLPKGGSASSVKARKHRIKEVMQELYPDVKVTQQNADALGILTDMVRHG